MPLKKLGQLCLEDSYAGLGVEFSSPALPTPFERPFVAAFNPDAARLIGLDPSEAANPVFADCFSGRRLLPGSKPVAMRYTGHQFGVYNPAIGDGRAILLGEARADNGVLWDLHLKGAGRTAYARSFDGRAVLRSTIREYLAGEAMHGLGIPTTRSLAIIGSDEMVRREKTEPGAMLVRMAESHVRFGSFEALYYSGEHDALKRLADYVIERHFRELRNDPEKYLLFFRGVVRRTAGLIAAWQAAGFAHGVMNTDNMSILGLTLDYGPYGFMEEADLSFIPNHSDETGRYAFDRQPPVALWNLACLAQALSPVVKSEASAAALEDFALLFERAWFRLMKEKLGLAEDAEGDSHLAGNLIKLLTEAREDYTIFFRLLGKLEAAEPEKARGFLKTDALKEWYAKYRARLGAERRTPEERRRRMDAANPKYILRNYLAQTAIEKAEAGDYTEIERLRSLLSRPFAEQPEMESYADPAPEWAKKICVSCSS